MKVKSIKIIDKPNAVYNLRIKHIHNYVANGLVVSNCHTAKSYQISEICNDTFRDTPIRWGFTGTIPKPKDEQYALRISFGPIIHKLGSYELQEKGILSDCNITCVRLKDMRTFDDYQVEVSTLDNDKNRLKYIADYISEIVKKQGNSLVLVGHVKVGQDLEQLIAENGINSVFLSGSVKSVKRFEEYNKVKTENNKCIVATSAIASTGLDIPRLFNLFLIDSGKSFTRTIQSIGRVLRKASDKDYADVYDISSTTPYYRRHFNQRLQYYKEKQFKYNIVEVNNWKTV